MAITFDTISIAGKEREVLTLSGEDDARRFILKDNISKRDLEIFTEIEADGTGATLEAKFEAWTLEGNGRKASETYAGMIRDFVSFNRGCLISKAQGYGAKQVADLLVEIDELEAEIAAG